MAWSKVNSKHKKPLMWWYHKIICEIAYKLKMSKKYYTHLNIMCDKYGYNLYGDKFNNTPLIIQKNIQRKPRAL